MPLRIEIVTPTRLVFRGTADSFAGPGAIGEFGVLPRHLPLLAALRTGVVTCVEKGKTRKLAVGPGFAEVAHDRVLLLTDDAFDPESFATTGERDEALRAATAERDSADARMRSWTGPIDATEFVDAGRAYEWASARVGALT